MVCKFEQQKCKLIELNPRDLSTTRYKAGQQKATLISHTSALLKPINLFPGLYHIQNNWAKQSCVKLERKSQPRSYQPQMTPKLKHLYFILIMSALITVQAIGKYVQIWVLRYFKCNYFSLRALLSSPTDVWPEVPPETKKKLSIENTD